MRLRQHRPAPQSRAGPPPDRSAAGRRACAAAGTATPPAAVRRPGRTGRASGPVPGTTPKTMFPPIPTGSSPRTAGAPPAPRSRAGPRPAWKNRSFPTPPSANRLRGATPSAASFPPGAGREAAPRPPVRSLRAPPPAATRAPVGNNPATAPPGCSSPAPYPRCRGGSTNNYRRSHRRDNADAGRRPASIAPECSATMR